MEISRFFSLPEMVVSDTARRENIANDPADAEIECLRALCGAVLDPLRESIAKPITVNSGYRSVALNARIGGVKDSQHVRGEAADIQCPGMSVLELFKTVIRRRLPFDQLIFEARSATAKWVHVSHRAEANRGEIMVAQFGADGKPLAYPRFTAEAALAITEPATRGRLDEIVLEFEESADEPIDPAPTRDASPDRAAPTPPKPSRPTRATKRPAKKRPAKKAAKKQPPKKQPAKKAVR